MAQRGKNPGDAANAFVRVLLSEAGRLAGGLNDDQWEYTLEYFGHCCAYTGEREDIVKEHAIPINKTHCGLHVYGNVVPATKKANSRKSDKDYKEFLKGDIDRLHRIERFMENARYRERTEPFNHIRRFCQTEYDHIIERCAKNKEHLRRLMPDNAIHVNHDGDGVRASVSSKSPVKDLIVKLLAQVDKDGFGLSDQRIADIVCDDIGAKTTARSVACYKTYARKGQHGITRDQADAILKVKRRR